MTWIRAAAAVASYRRMYELAGEIVAHDDAEKAVRRAARRILRSLENLIELPIADGAKLARAVLRFRELQQELARVCALAEISDNPAHEARLPSIMCEERCMDRLPSVLQGVDGPHLAVAKGEGSAAMTGAASSAGAGAGQHRGIDEQRGQAARQPGTSLAAAAISGFR